MKEIQSNVKKPSRFYDRATNGESYVAPYVTVDKRGELVIDLQNPQGAGEKVEKFDARAELDRIAIESGIIPDNGGDSTNREAIQTWLNKDYSPLTKYLRAPEEEDGN